MDSHIIWIKFWGAGHLNGSQITDKPNSVRDIQATITDKREKLNGHSYAPSTHFKNSTKKNSPQKITHRKREGVWGLSSLTDDDIAPGVFTNKLFPIAVENGFADQFSDEYLAELYFFAAGWQARHKGKKPAALFIDLLKRCEMNRVSDEAIDAAKRIISQKNATIPIAQEMANRLTAGSVG